MNFILKSILKSLEIVSDDLFLFLFPQERIGEQFEDLIAPGDIGKVTGHLGEALHSGQATSQVYRVKVSYAIQYIYVYDVVTHFYCLTSFYMNRLSHKSFHDFQVGGDRFIRVQTKSKLFRDTDGTQPEGSFIMATHTIIG